MMLSIITVNLNNVSGLNKTINSVFYQTFTDFEYIIIDGGSTDGSLQIIEEQKAKFSYWSSEKDCGVYNAMNKGIKVAKGEYLLFLNSGDFLESNDTLQKVFSRVHNCDILCGRCNISDKGKVVWTTNPPLNISFGTLYDEGLAHQATFIKKTLFERYGYYREEFKFISDLEFWIRTIILNTCSTENVELIISEYNLDGMSSNPENDILIQKEKEKIYSHPILQKFVRDYDQWRNERKEMAIFYWVHSNKMLRKLNISFYKLAVFIQKIKKNGIK